MGQRRGVRLSPVLIDRVHVGEHHQHVGVQFDGQSRGSPVLIDDGLNADETIFTISADRDSAPARANWDTTSRQQVLKDIGLQDCPW